MGTSEAGQAPADEALVARAVTGSTALAEEVTQEVFLELMCTLDRYDASRGEVPADFAVRDQPPFPPPPAR